MGQEEMQEFSSPLPVLPRLDRLDRLAQAKSVVRTVEAEDQCKNLSSVLEEVQHKGTLMDRLEMLENRVLQEIPCAAESCARISKVERGTGDGSQWDAIARYPQQLGKNQFSLPSSTSCSFHEALLV